MIKGSLMIHLGPIWYHSEPSDVPCSQNLPRPISWFGLFLQQNDSSIISILYLRGTLLIQGISLDKNSLQKISYTQDAVLEMQYKFHNSLNSEPLKMFFFHQLGFFVFAKMLRRLPNQRWKSFKPSPRLWSWYWGCRSRGTQR